MGAILERGGVELFFLYFADFGENAATAVCDAVPAVICGIRVDDGDQVAIRHLP